jgi:hypothetical protein
MAYDGMSLDFLWRSALDDFGVGMNEKHLAFKALNALISLFSCVLSQKCGIVTLS